MPNRKLIGGMLCLDFVNTVDDMDRDAGDCLTDWSALTTWAVRAGGLSEESAQASAEWGRENPAEAEGDLARVKTLRRSLYQVLKPLTDGREPPEESLAVIGDAWSDLLDRASLASDGGGEGFSWSWQNSERRESDAITGPLVASAIDLLTGDDLGRLGQCHGPNCTWLFLDTSRGPRRRWCRMATCGNRAKARRHYARARQESGVAKDD